jgi:hypothetical protein
VNVGVIAGNGERKTDAAGRWNGKGEGSAAGFDVERKTSIYGKREFRGSSEHGGVRGVFEFEWDALAVPTNIKNGHACGERNFGFAFVKNFAVQLDGAADRLVGGPQIQFSALHDEGNGRNVWLARGLAGQFHQMVVFVERQSDASGGRHGDGFVLRKQANGQKQNGEQNCLFHFTPAFFSR